MSKTEVVNIFIITLHTRYYFPYQQMDVKQSGYCGHRISLFNTLNYPVKMYIYLFIYKYITDLFDVQFSLLQKERKQLKSLTPPPPPLHHTLPQPSPSTPLPQPRSLNHAPSTTLNHAPSTTLPQPRSLNHAPSTTLPQPRSLNHAPSTTLPPQPRFLKPISLKPHPLFACVNCIFMFSVEIEQKIMLEKTCYCDDLIKK